jgi:superoxide dismutase
MIELDEKTAKALFALHESVKAAILDVLDSREKTDEQLEAVVSQMFGQCLWAILTKSEEQDKVIHSMLERYKSKA